MKEKMLEMLTGTVVLVLAGALLSYAYIREKSDTFRGYPLVVRFEKADGLTVGSDVKMSGIKVGRVDSLHVDSDTYDAVATILVKEGLHLPKDTSAAIISESLLGGKYLALTPGGDEEYLKPGGTITHAQSSVILESLIGQMVFGNKDKDKDGSSKEKKTSPGDHDDDSL